MTKFTKYFLQDCFYLIICEIIVSQEKERCPNDVAQIEFLQSRVAQLQHAVDENEIYKQGTKISIKFII